MGLIKDGTLGCSLQLENPYGGGSTGCASLMFVFFPFLSHLCETSYEDSPPRASRRPCRPESFRNDICPIV